METPAFEMPQIKIAENMSMTQLVAEAGSRIEIIPKLRKENEHSNIVDGLQEIAVGIEYEDGSEDPSIMGAAYSKALEIATVLNDRKTEVETMPEVLTSAQKVLGGIFDVDTDHTRRLRNTIGSESGDEITHQVVETKVSTDDEGHTSLLVSFSESYKEDVGNASISIPLSPNLEVVDHKQAKIMVQSGSLSNYSFSEVGKKIVDAANQAAIKFQIYGRETDTILARNGLFKKT